MHLNIFVPLGKQVSKFGIYFYILYLIGEKKGKQRDDNKKPYPFFNDEI
jgi:hypothetical protein